MTDKELKVYYYRHLGVDEWDSQRTGWSRRGVIAESEEQAFEFFNISKGSQPFYRLMSRRYSGKRKPGTKVF
jgi:hypothetical protein